VDYCPVATFQLFPEISKPPPVDPSPLSTFFLGTIRLRKGCCISAVFLSAFPLLAFPPLKISFFAFRVCNRFFFPYLPVPFLVWGAGTVLMSEKQTSSFLSQTGSRIFLSQISRTVLRIGPNLSVIALEAVPLQPSYGPIGELFTARFILLQRSILLPCSAF